MEIKEVIEVIESFAERGNFLKSPFSEYLFKFGAFSGYMLRMREEGVSREECIEAVSSYNKVLTKEMFESRRGRLVIARYLCEEELDKGLYEIMYYEEDGEVVVGIPSLGKEFRYKGYEEFGKYWAVIIEG